MVQPAQDELLGEFGIEDARQRPVELSNLDGTSQRDAPSRFLRIRGGPRCRAPESHRFRKRRLMLPPNSDVALGAGLFYSD
jgi:hypothetical protein